MIVTIIIGILASIAIPGYRKTMEKGYGDKAKVVLQTIYTAEKLYRLDYNTYGTLNSLISNKYIENPNTADRKFEYSTYGTPTTTTFQARATRIGTNNQYLAINQDGPLSSYWKWPK